MKFFPTFFRSFYSAALYLQLRTGGQGYGLRYSAWLLLLTAVLVTFTGYVLRPELLADAPLEKLSKLPLPQIVAMGVGILLVAYVVRIAMLFALAVAARLVALKITPRMDYPAAMRMASVAYTPIAVLDAASFCATGSVPNPFLLFGLAFVMLIATLYASRGSD